MAKAAEERLVVRLDANLTRGLTPGFGGGGYEDGIHVGGLEKAEGGGAAGKQFGGAASEVAHELGQMEDGVEFESDGDEGLGTAAVLLGMVQVAGQFEGDGNLGGESAGAPDVFVVDGPGGDAVENAEHAQHIAVGTEQGDGEELANFESLDEIQIGARSFGSVFCEEHIFLFQRAGGGALGERDIEGTGNAIFDSPANVESVLFEESDDTALEAEKAGGANYGGVHELVEFPGGTEFEGNLEDFVELMGLGAGHAVEFGVGHGDSAKSGQSGNQGFVFLGKGDGGAGINQDRAVGARGSKGRGDEDSGQRVISEMRSTVDAHGNALASGDGADGDLEG